MASSTLMNLNPAAQAFSGKTPAPMAASDSSGTSASGSSGAATVTANDFLTLLVAEMKNQDPTANRDPNEYINQLVQVNSLQQLISINEVLTNALGTASASSGNTANTEAARSAGVPASIAASTLLPSASPATTAASQAPLTPYTTGNLGIPAATTHRRSASLMRSMEAGRQPGPRLQGLYVSRMQIYGTTKETERGEATWQASVFRSPDSRRSLPR